MNLKEILIWGVSKVCIFRWGIQIWAYFFDRMTLSFIIFYFFYWQTYPSESLLEDIERYKGNHSDLQSQIKCTYLLVSELHEYYWISLQGTISWLPELCQVTQVLLWFILGHQPPAGLLSPDRSIPLFLWKVLSRSLSHHFNNPLNTLRVARPVEHLHWGVDDVFHQRGA